MPERKPLDWQGLISLAMVCGTVVFTVWLLSS